MNLEKSLQKKLNKFKEIYNMSEITGIVKKVEKKTSTRGKTYYVVTMLEGTMMGAWDFELIRGVKVGEQATILYEEDGKYKNITGSTPVIQQDSEIPWEEPTPPTTTPPLTVDKQVLIIRQSSLRSAVELIKGTEDAVNAEKILIVAKRFEEFVKAGE